MLYQNENCFSGQNYRFWVGRGLNFQPHLHSGFELIAVTEGEMSVCVNEVEYRVNKNECVFVFPNQVHEIRSYCDNSYFIIVFSPKMIDDYSNEVCSLVPLSNAFCAEKALLDDLRLACEEKAFLRIKGNLYVVCDKFDKTAEYQKRSATGEGVH